MNWSGDCSWTSFRSVRIFTITQSKTPKFSIIDTFSRMQRTWHDYERHWPIESIRCKRKREGSRRCSSVQQSVIFVYRVNIHSLREYLALEMIEEERLKKGLIFEESIIRSPRKRLNKSTVLSQDRPDVRDLVGSLWFVSIVWTALISLGWTSREKLPVFSQRSAIRFEKSLRSSNASHVSPAGICLLLIRCWSTCLMSLVSVVRRSFFRRWFDNRKQHRRSRSLLVSRN